MDLLQIETSKITLLTIVQRPGGQLFLPRAAVELVKRYQFQKFPTDLLAEPPLTFEHGLFRDSAIDEFQIYNDGIIVTSASPADLLDDFLTDLFTWAEAQLGLKEVPALRVGKVYESAVVVAMNIDDDKLLPWAAPAMKLLREKWEQGGRPAGPITFQAARLTTDPVNRNITPVAFRLERRANIPFEKGIYFSTAPLSTADHLEVLAQIEKTLAR
jgi:hypothetical protein